MKSKRSSLVLPEWYIGAFRAVSRATRFLTFCFIVNDIAMRSGNNEKQPNRKRRLTSSCIHVTHLPVDLLNSLTEGGRYSRHASQSVWRRSNMVAHTAPSQNSEAPPYYITALQATKKAKFLMNVKYGFIYRPLRCGG